jgi:acyl-CoA thioester hydrolase
MTARADFRLVHPLRVRWGECDMQGVVFNAHYFAYYDIAVTEWTRALGFRWSEAPEFMAVHAECDFKAPASYDDNLDLAIRAALFGTKSLEMAAAIFRGDELLNVGRLVYAHVRRGTRETAPFEEDFIARVSAFERLEPGRKKAS